MNYKDFKHRAIRGHREKIYFIAKSFEQLRASRKDFTTEMHRDVHRAHWDNIRVRKLNSEIRSESAEKRIILLLRVLHAERADWIMILNDKNI